MKVPTTHGQIRKLVRRESSRLQAILWHVMKQRNSWRDLALQQAKVIRELQR